MKGICEFRKVKKHSFSQAYVWIIGASTIKLPMRLNNHLVLDLFGLKN